MPDAKIDRHTCHRVVPMKVLVLGLMRTGTACKNPQPHPITNDVGKADEDQAMCKALSILGYHETYHMLSVFASPSDSDMWTEAFEAKYVGGKPFTRENWDQLLGHCQVSLNEHPSHTVADRTTRP